MHLTLKLYATLGDYLPPGTRHNRVELEAAEDVTVEGVLQPYGLPPRLIHLVLVNGVFVPQALRGVTVLKDGDVLAVWPPIAGG